MQVISRIFMKSVKLDVVLQITLKMNLKFSDIIGRRFIET